MLPSSWGRPFALQAFALADNVLLSGVRSVSDLMTKPGLINLDFSDLQAVMADMGPAIMGAQFLQSSTCLAHSYSKHHITSHTYHWYH